MSGNNNDIVVSIKGTSTLERAKFGPGMLLRHDDLEQLTTYPRELSRLLFRSLFGCGVVCGLVVQRPEDKCDRIWVRVSSGLALDCAGNPIHVPKDSDPLSFDPKCEDKPLWVILCGKTTACSPRTAACASDDEESSPVPSREKDGYEIRIVRTLPKCICACLKEQATDPAKEGASAPAKELEPEPEPERKCPCVGPENPCYTAHYEGKCGCGEGNDCDCCCDCVVLARLEKLPNEPWTVTHKVRRFVRPVLMRDPQVAIERGEAAKKKAKETAAKVALDKAVAEKVAVAVAEEKAVLEKAAAEKAAVEKAAAERNAERLQQLAKPRAAPVLREKARSSRSKRSSK